MFQKAGAGTQSSPTVDIASVVQRFKDFPAIAGANPVAYETEVATYDTLPLPIPTPEEQEAFTFALLDAREKKLRYIQTRNDLDFALRNPLFFQDPPPSDVLMAASQVYTRLINAVMDHAIRLSRGQIVPPQLFDPSMLSPPVAEPAPIRLQRVMVASAPGGALVTIPDWHRMEEVQDLGFLDIVVQPLFETSRPTGTIVSITPLPGTQVEAAGTVVEITVVRNTVTDPIPEVAPG
jgi:PASTA domain